MQNFLTEVVKIIADGARTYVKDTYGPIVESILLPMIDRAEKFILDLIVPLPAVQDKVSAAMAARGMSAPQ